MIILSDLLDVVIDITELDPFMGTGTVGRVADRTGREFIGIDINPEYCQIERWK